MEYNRGVLYSCVTTKKRNQEVFVFILLISPWTVGYLTTFVSILSLYWYKVGTSSKSGDMT